MSFTLVSAPEEGRALRERHRPRYLASLTAPMDDMWMSFAEEAAVHGLHVDGVEAGSLCVDGEGRLLRLWIEPAFQGRAEELLAFAAGRLGFREARLPTLDPLALGVALDVAREVESVSLFFAHGEDPVVAPLEGLVPGEPEDHGRLVTFEEAATGAPRAFLEGYVRERLDRRELWLHLEAGEILAVGELRRDPWQAGVAHLGLMVAEDRRGEGLGSRLLSALVERGRGEGLRLACSTEKDHLGARRAIDRAGFRPLHRLLRVVLELD